MPRVRHLTVEEVVDMSMNDIDSVDDEVDVVTFVADGSDKADGNDDEIGAVKITDVPGEAEVHYQEPFIEGNAPPPSKKRRTRHMAPVWRNDPPGYTGWQVPSNAPEEALPGSWMGARL